MVRFVFLASFLAAACGRDKNAERKDTDHAGQVATACAGKGEHKGPITWFEDDWDGAVACAKARNVPIVLDLWAPWCHTCISMQTTVFMDPSFKAKADKFVWAALDADREANARAIGKYATSAMPTFYVIGPDEKVLARFVGAATLQQFHDFIDAGARAASGGIAAADAKLLSAESALAARDLEAADRDLTAALAMAPPEWPRRVEAVASLQLTKKKRGDHAGCIDVSDANIDKVGATATATNFWSSAIECAGDLAKDPPAGADPIKTKSVQQRAVANLAKVVDDANAPLSIDDRAEALSYLRDAQDAMGQKDAAKTTAEKLRTLLDDAWKKAPTPFARMTYLWPRAEVYAWLQRPLDIIADYEKMAAELPTEYDPPARLGWLYLSAGKFPEAAAWTDKALALVYGPRKARVLTQRADIAKAAGDAATERAMREQVVKLWESLPAGQQKPDQLAKAKAALEALH
jgi:tetratricopeptide (TPR) repeat protein